MIFNELPRREIASLTEWMEKINIPNILEFRQEDNLKYDRLEKLRKIIGINYNVPERIAIDEITKKTDKYREFCAKRAGTKCNIRLIPKAPIYQKLRIRAVHFEDGIKWLENQKIKPEHYNNIEVLEYNDRVLYSVIFLINKLGIWGEAIEGDLWQLASGMHRKQLNLFNFNFKKWSFSKNDQRMTRFIKESIRPLLINDESQQEKLKSTLNAEFTPEGYLKGYFEILIWPGEKTLYVDYNRVIYYLMKDVNLFLLQEQPDGMCANPGMAHGKIRIIEHPQTESFANGDILVCKIPTLDYVPIIKKAGAIIIEQGNVLSHIAIVSRELNKPCVVMAKNVTKKLRDGDEIFMDASQGLIFLTSR